MKKKVNEEKKNVVFNVINILILVINIYYKEDIKIIWLLVQFKFIILEKY
jgi:hypothetical protein